MPGKLRPVFRRSLKVVMLLLSAEQKHSGSKTLWSLMALGHCFLSRSPGGSVAGCIKEIRTRQIQVFNAFWRMKPRCDETRSFDDKTVQKPESSLELLNEEPVLPLGHRSSRRCAMWQQCRDMIVQSDSERANGPIFDIKIGFPNAVFDEEQLSLEVY
jgi:hypothetical protein